MQINAVTERPTFDISAALGSREMTAVRSLMAAANIAPTARITVAELDQKLADSRLSTLQKLELKVAMTRAGILV
jgi:hypothetical protein